MTDISEVSPKTEESLTGEFFNLVALVSFPRYERGCVFLWDGPRCSFDPSLSAYEYPADPER